MNLRVIAGLAIISILASCGDSGTSATKSSSSVQASSGVVLSSGQILSSGQVLSSGAEVSSSSAVAEGAIPGLGIMDSSGYWWLTGNVKGTQAPDAITAEFFLNGTVVSAANASIEFGVTLNQYVIKPSVNVLDIPLSGANSLQTKVNWGDNACMGDYQVVVTVTAGTSVIKDTADYTYDYGINCAN